MRNLAVERKTVMVDQRTEAPWPLTRTSQIVNIKTLCPCCQDGSTTRRNYLEAAKTVVQKLTLKIDLLKRKYTSKWRIKRKLKNEQIQNH